MNVRTRIAAASLAALSILALATALPASAQDKMTGKMQDNKMSGKMGDKMMKGPVYVSKMSKMYYSEADAKKMKMMDARGNKLVKMTKAPAGYKMGKMKTMDKMDNKMQKTDKMTPGTKM